MISTEKYIPGSDTGFADAIQGGKVVLISIYSRYTGLKQKVIKTVLKQPPDEISDVLDPLEDIGVANLSPGMDGYIRCQAPFIVDEEHRFRYAFSFLVARKFLDLPLDHDDQYRKLFVGNTMIPLENHGRMIINYAGPPGSFETMSFLEIWQKAIEGDQDYFKRHFRGKAVLISSAGGFSSDYHRTPFNGLGNPDQMSGVEIQANILNTIIKKRFLKELPPFLNYSILYILILSSALVAYFSRSYKAFALFFLLVAGYSIIALSLFINSGIILKISVPLSGMIFVYFGVSIWSNVFKESEKKRINEAFGRYVSPEVVDEILFRPGAMNLGGELREITIFFSDINGFTSMSEQMEPEEVVAILNEYFDAMINIMYEYHGTLKQIVGDELMILFNAPVPLEDHKLKAVQCGIKMQKYLDRWNIERVKSGKREVRVKIGINSGTVVVGNIGSKDRMEYTTIGDAVNTAARIMDLNKELKTKSQILISSDIYEAVKDKVHLIKEYRTEVRGKKDEITVYEID